MPKAYDPAFPVEYPETMYDENDNRLYEEGMTLLHWTTTTLLSRTVQIMPIGIPETTKQTIRDENDSSLNEAKRLAKKLIEEC